MRASAAQTDADFADRDGALTWCLAVAVCELGSRSLPIRHEKAPCSWIGTVFATLQSRVGRAMRSTGTSNVSLFEV
jgi:hypothetical protein